MGKGLEDTALYRYYPLVSRNEVGSDFTHPPGGIADFHRHNERMARRSPLRILTTSTHDTKRSEDVRARIHSLSERPEEFVGRWPLLFEELRGLGSQAHGELIPSPRLGFLLAQTLLGSWPIDVAGLRDYPSRLAQYLVKAEREAGERTSWDNANTEDEAALVRLSENVGRAPVESSFRQVLDPLRHASALRGASYGLSQVGLKLTSVGVPDIYQGCELWDLSLVDPDNRLAVNFAHRERLLKRLAPDRPVPPSEWSRLRRGWPSGAVKLLLTARLLRLRRDNPALQPGASYRRLRVRGANGVVAFERRPARPLLCCGCPQVGSHAGGSEGHG